MANEQLTDLFMSYLENEKRYSINTLISYRDDLKSLVDFLDREGFGRQAGKVEQSRKWLMILD